MDRRTWVGSSVLTLVGIGLEWYGLREEWHPAIRVGIAVAVVVGVLLTFPRRSASTSPAERRTIVRGDASGSSFERFRVKGADSFVEGNAKNALFRDIWFRARRGKR